MSHAFAESCFVPARFALGVPTHDGCLLTLDGSASLELRMPAFASGTESASTAERRRTAHHLVFLHDLYPIIPPNLHISALPHGIWDANEEQARAHWLRAMYTAGYVPHVTSAEDYYLMVGVRGLFGPRANPIDSVLQLAIQLGVHDVLFHHVMSVALQFYLVVRQAFLCRRTDSEWQFDESLPPSVFAMYRASDWSIEGRDTAPELTADNLEQQARTLHFPAFLDGVLAWVLRTNPDAVAAAPHLADECRAFVTDKLQKNFMQALTCMRFREMQPANLVERLHEAGHTGARLKAIKFFAHPKVCRMPSLDGCGASVRVPQFFTHAFFSPDTPLQTTATTDSGLVWRLAIYYPLLIFKQHVLVAARKLFQCAVLPVTAAEKHAQYDPAMALCPVRARYCMYFRDAMAHAYVPNLLLPELVARDTGLLAHDEADVRHFSPDAWAWCINRGHAMIQAGTHMPVCTPAADTIDHRMASDMMAKSSGNGLTVRHAWPLFWAMARVYQSEEYAAAMLERACGLSLPHVCESYASFRAECVQTLQQVDAERVQPLLTEWDRCTHMQVACPPDLQFVWRMLFPVSVIQHGRGHAWVGSWRAAPFARGFRAGLDAIRAILARPLVQRDLKAIRLLGAEGVPSDLRVDFELASQIEASATIKFILAD